MHFPRYTNSSSSSCVFLRFDYGWSCPYTSGIIYFQLGKWYDWNNIGKHITWIKTISYSDNKHCSGGRHLSARASQFSGNFRFGKANIKTRNSGSSVGGIHHPSDGCRCSDANWITGHQQLTGWLDYDHEDSWTSINGIDVTLPSLNKQCSGDV